MAVVDFPFEFLSCHEVNFVDEIDDLVVQIWIARIFTAMVSISPEHAKPTVRLLRGAADPARMRLGTRDGGYETQRWTLTL